ncbi:MAG: ROK family protein [Roseiflexaceae bacterium]
MSDPQTLVQERLHRRSWGFLGSQGYVLGMDIGSYGLRASLIDLAGHTYASAYRNQDDIQGGPEAIIQAAIGLANGLLAEHGVQTSHLVRVGVGFGGPIDARRGLVLVSHRMAGWEQFPLKQRIEDAFGAVTLVDNDANLIALAEATFGIGHTKHHLFYLHLSRGVGGGLVLNGKLYHGATTTAGEIGHAVVGMIDPIYPQQIPGTLEQRVSIKALLRRAAELGYDTDLLSDLFGPHPIAQQVVSEAVDLLAMRLSQIVALIDPEVIVIGGAVARSGGEPFLHAIQDRMRFYMASLVERPVPLEASVLGSECVAIGGLALALESMAD